MIEAQFCAIPALTSDRGGLPGRLVRAASASERCAASVWAGALTVLWADGARYIGLSGAALDRFGRADLDLERQVSLFVDCIALRALARLDVSCAQRAIS